MSTVTEWKYWCLAIAANEAQALAATPTLRDDSWTDSNVFVTHLSGGAFLCSIPQKQATHDRTLAYTGELVAIATAPRAELETAWQQFIAAQGYEIIPNE